MFMAKRASVPKSNTAAVKPEKSQLVKTVYQIKFRTRAKLLLNRKLKRQKRGLSQPISGKPILTTTDVCQLAKSIIAIVTRSIKNLDDYDRYNMLEVTFWLGIKLDIYVSVLYCHLLLFQV